MARALGAALTIACMACGTPGEPTTATPLVVATAPVPAPSDPGPPPPSPSAPAAKGPAALEAVARPAAIACTLSSAYWETTADLAFAPGKPPFADIRAKTKVEIAIGEATAKPQVFVTAHVGTLVVEGSVERPLAVHPTRAFLATPYLAPTPGVDALVVGGGKGTLRVELGLAREIIPARDGDLVVERPCADLGLYVASFTAESVFGAGPKKKTMAFTRAKAALLDAPSGAKLADLVVGGDDRVAVLEEKAGHARVLWHLGGAVAHGWISSAELGTPKPSGAGVVTGNGIAGEKANAIALSSHKLTCTGDIPLVVRQRGERRIVGRIAGGTLLHLYESADGFRHVETNEQGIWLKEGCVYEVREADIAAGCTSE